MRAGFLFRGLENIRETGEPFLCFLNEEDGYELQW